MHGVIPNDFSHMFRLEPKFVGEALKRLEELLEKQKQSQQQTQTLITGCRGLLLAEKYKVPCPGTYGEIPGRPSHKLWMVLELWEEEVPLQDGEVALKAMIVPLHFSETSAPVFGETAYKTHQRTLQTLQEQGHIQQVFENIRAMRNRGQQKEETTCSASRSA